MKIDKYEENIKEVGKKYMDKNICKLNIEYIDFNGNEKTGILEVHNEVKDEVISIFNEIKSIKFPIFQIKTVDNYDFDDEKSVIANNTSGYNFRFVKDTTKLSDHAIGLAIDINPKQNPWLHPSALNLFKYNPGEKGTIEVDDQIVKIFSKYGWSWGGNWKNPDYQHFFKGGEVNKSIKNKLYSDLKIQNPYLQTVSTPGKKPQSRISKFKEFIKRHLT